MSWVRHDDSFSSHPKVIGLSDKAYRLHFCALEYCSRHLTDGFITPLALRSLAVSSEIRRPNSVANALVIAGLWHELEGSIYEIHDYLEYNQSAADAKAERKKAAERMKNLRRLRSGVRSPEHSPARSGSPSRPSSLSNDKGRTFENGERSPYGTHGKTPRLKSAENFVANGLLLGVPSENRVWTLMDEFHISEEDAERLSALITSEPPITIGGDAP